MQSTALERQVFSIQQQNAKLMKDGKVMLKDLPKFKFYDASYDMFYKQNFIPIGNLFNHGHVEIDKPCQVPISTQKMYTVY